MNLKVSRTNGYGGIPTALQALEDGTGESIRTGLCDVLRRVPELERVASIFPLALRHSCCDRYTGNFKAEKLLSKDFPKLQAVAHFTCDVHKLYSVMECSTHSQDFDISGILSIGVGISPDVSCVRTMRQILARIFANKLVIIHADPPEEYAAYRKQLLDMFLPVRKLSLPGKHTGIRQSLQRRWIINNFLNGDLSQQHEIQHYCGYGCCESPSHTLRYMAHYLTWALCPCKCPKFARSRWTNWLDSIQWTGLLAGLHNLLESVIIEYTGGPGKGVDKAEQQQTLLPVDNQHQQDRTDGWDELFQEELEQSELPKPIQQDIPNSAHAFPAPNAEAPDVPADVKDEEHSTKKAFDWKGFNRKQRGNAREWVQSDPYPRLVILRLVAGVLMSLMYRFLALGGLPWERRQQLRSARGLPRQYPITIAAEGQDISLSMKELHKLFFADVLCLPRFKVTPQLKAMKFRLISSALCALHIYLRLPRRGSPYILFKTLLGCIDLVADFPECMWDELMHTIRSKYDPCRIFKFLFFS